MGDMELVALRKKRLVALGGDSKDMGLVALGDMELVVVGDDSGDMGLVALRGGTGEKEAGGTGGHGAGGTGRWQQGHGAHSGCMEPPALPAIQNRGLSLSRDVPTASGTEGVNATRGL